MTAWVCPRCRTRAKKSVKGRGGDGGRTWDIRCTLLCVGLLPAFALWRWGDGNGGLSTHHDVPSVRGERADVLGRYRDTPNARRVPLVTRADVEGGDD